MAADEAWAVAAVGATICVKTLSAADTWIAWQWRHSPKWELLTYGSKPHIQKMTPASALRLRAGSVRREVSLTQDSLAGS